MRGPGFDSRRARATVVAGLLALILAGCGAAQQTGTGAPSASGTPGSSSTDPSTAPSPSNTPQVPTDGVTLAQLGFEHGPALFSLPRGASITTASDQENTVTLVLTDPSAVDLAAYFRRAWPLAGYDVTGAVVDGDTATVGFTAGEWRGSVTGRADTTGVTMTRAAS